MGSFLSTMVKGLFTDTPCKAFFQDFPSNMGRSSLPYIIGDSMGLTCNKGGWQPGVNIAANVATAIVLQICNKKVGFLKSLNSVLPTIFGKDEATNATILEYLILNAILFLYQTNSGNIITDDPAETALNCIFNPIKCMGEFIGWAKGLKPATCPLNYEDQGSLCYKQCDMGYKGVVTECVAMNPQEPGWRDDGDFIFNKNNYARDSYWEKEKPVPPGCKKTAVCTMECEGDGDTVRVEDERIFNREVGADLSDLGWKGYRRGLDSWIGKYGAYITRGGVYTNCNLTQGCSENYELHGAICYEKVRPGFHCDLLYCYKDCPPNFTDAGISCHRNMYDRGVGKLRSQCPKGYRWDQVSLCIPLSKEEGGPDPDGDGGSPIVSWLPWIVGGVAVAGGGIYLATRGSGGAAKKEEKAIPKLYHIEEASPSEATARNE